MLISAGGANFLFSFFHQVKTSLLWFFFFLNLFGHLFGPLEPFGFLIYHLGVVTDISIQGWPAHWALAATSTACSHIFLLSKNY